MRQRSQGDHVRLFRQRLTTASQNPTLRYTSVEAGDKQLAWQLRARGWLDVLQILQSLYGSVFLFVWRRAGDHTPRSAPQNYTTSRWGLSIANFCHLYQNSDIPKLCKMHNRNLEILCNLTNEKF